MTGHLPSLVVLRGPSGSGKSTTAMALRRAAGRGVAVVGQDVIRRDLLRERDRPGAANIDLIALNVNFCLGRGYDVILEGILPAVRYGSMIRGLISDHPGPSFVYLYAIPFPETLRRHATKPNADEFGPNEMAAWYQEQDVLGVPGEQLIGPDESQAETVTRIVTDAFPARGAGSEHDEPAARVHGG